MSGLDNMVSSLEQYYAVNNSWTGVDKIMTDLEPGPGMMRGSGMGGHGTGQEIMRADAILTDVDGNILAETGNPSVSRTISTTALETSIPLRNNNHDHWLLVRIWWCKPQTR